MKLYNLKFYCLLVLFNLGCVPKKLNHSFQYTYRLSSSIHFDHTGSSKIGTIDINHNAQKTQKFRHSSHTPRLYLYDKNTKKCYPFPIVLYNPAPEKVDSVFWALLDSATYHYPVPPNKIFSFTSYINLSLLSRNAVWMREHIKQNIKNLEFHCLIRQSNNLRWLLQNKQTVL